MKRRKLRALSAIRPVRSTELPPVPRSQGQSSAFPPGTPVVADFNVPISNSDSGLGGGAYRNQNPTNISPQEPSQGALIDRPLGDAGAGLPALRTSQFFWQVHPAGAVLPNPILDPIVLVQARSYDRRIRLWHVGISGRDVVSDAGGGATPASFTSITAGLQDGALAATAMKARIEIQDQSGRRFQDIDVLGNRMFEVYGWAVKVYAMISATGYEVSQVTPQNNAVIGGIVSNSIFGASISPIVVNGTQVPDRVTRFVNVLNNTAQLVPTPPGASTVQIHSTTLVPPGGLLLQFDTGAPLGTAALSSLGAITFAAGAASTTVLEIPNALAISLGGGGQPAGSFTFVYTIQP